MGEYNKRGKRISSPRVRVPTGSLPTVPQDVPRPRTHESSAALILSRSQAWGVALLVALLLGVVGIVAYHIISGGVAAEHTRHKVKDLEHKVDQLETNQQAIERQLVQVQTELENLH